MVRRFLVIVCCLAACTPATSRSAPEILYTDLDTAPAGAFVSIYGSGFRAEAGGVYFGAVQATAFSWSDTRITVIRPDTAEQQVVVKTRDGAESNGIDVALHEGRIFYVGDADSPPAGSKGARVDSITEYLRKSRPGDVAYVREGVHRDIGDTVYGANVFVRPRDSGEPGRPVAIVGYPGEAAQIGDSNTKHAVFVFDDVENFTLANLKLTGTVSALTLSPKGVRRNIRIVGNEANDIEAYYGVFRLNSTHGLRVLGNTILRGGVEGNKFSHLVYYAGFGPGDDVHISHNLLAGQVGGRCIQVYGHRAEDTLADIHIESNVIRDCQLDAILVGGSDERTNREWIEYASISGNVIRGAGGGAIRVNDAGLTAEVRANRIADAAVVLNLQAFGRLTVTDNVLLARSPAALARVGAGGTLDVSGNCYRPGSVWREDADARVCTRAEEAGDAGR